MFIYERHSNNRRTEYLGGGKQANRGLQTSTDSLVRKKEKRRKQGRRDATLVHIVFSVCVLIKKKGKASVMSWSGTRSMFKQNMQKCFRICALSY